MHLPTNLICLDLETTDSDNVTGSIIQISAIVVNQNFEPVHAREFNEYVCPLDSYRNPRAMEVNKISEEILRTASPLSVVLEMFESFTDNDDILAAWGNYFDIPFLKQQYKKIHREWPFSHRSFDLKSVAIWEMAKRNIPMSSGVNKFLITLGQKFEGQQHNALDDIKNTVRILKYLKNA